MFFNLFGKLNFYTPFLLLVIMIILASVVVGALTALGYFWLLVTSLAGIAVYILIMHNWRLGFYGLVLYIPFAAIPTFILYPAPGWTKLLKDVLFIVPMYVSFLFWWSQHQRRNKLFPSNISFIPLGILIGIIIVQSFNPSVYTPLIALIGLKVWLFYIPLYILSYHFLDTKERLFQIVNVLLFVGIIPVLFGIIQAIFIYSGQKEIAYALYGQAVQSATQNFAHFTLEGTDTHLVRISSTFVFVTQFFLFLLTIIPVCYAMWNKTTSQPTKHHFYGLLLILTILAAVLSGSRSAYVIIPLYFIIVSIVSGNWINAVKLFFWLGIALTMMITLLLGIKGQSLIDYVGDVTWTYIGNDKSPIYTEFIRASEQHWLGEGTGMSTNPARHAVSEDEWLSLLGLENFYAKTIAELSVFGLFSLIIVFTHLLYQGYHHFRSIKSPELRIFGLSLFSYLTIQMIYHIKGSFIDYDPTNTYFWIFTGFLMKLPSLENASSSYKRSHKWQMPRIK